MATKFAGAVRAFLIFSCPGNTILFGSVSGLSILQYNRWLAIRMVKKYGGFFLLPLDVAVGQLFDFRRESGERIVSQVKQF